MVHTSFAREVALELHQLLQTRHDALHRVRLLSGLEHRREQAGLLVESPLSGQIKRLGSIFNEVTGASLPRMLRAASRKGHDVTGRIHVPDELPDISPLLVR